MKLQYLDVYNYIFVLSTSSDSSILIRITFLYISHTFNISWLFNRKCYKKRFVICLVKLSLPTKQEAFVEAIEALWSPECTFHHGWVSPCDAALQSLKDMHCPNTYHTPWTQEHGARSKWEKPCPSQKVEPSILLVHPDYLQRLDTYKGARSTSHCRGFPEGVNVRSHPKINYYGSKDIYRVKPWKKGTPSWNPWEDRESLTLTA